MQKKRIFRLKHYRSILTLLTVLGDAGTIALSCWLAYILWGYLGPILAIEMYEKLDIMRYSLLFGATFITILIGFEVNGLYQPQRSILNVREFQLIFRTWIMALGVTMVILYMADELYFSRGIFVLTWGLSLFFLMVERYVFFKFNSFLNTLGLAGTVVLIYGTGVLAKRLVEKFRQSPKLGYQVAGFVVDTLEEPELLGIPVLGIVSDLQSILRESKAERLFVARSHVAYEKVIEILNVCSDAGCRFQVIPNMHDTVFERVRMSDIEGIPLFGIHEPVPGRLFSAVKRIWDVVLSLVLIVLLFPWVLMVISIIALSGRRPILKRNRFTGRHGRQFFLPRLNFFQVRPGSFLYSIRRNAGIAWYPQLFSILAGEMSFVGPRPELQIVIDTYSAARKYKLIVRPGLTGLWDVAGRRQEMIYEDEDLDIYYIRNCSFFMDMIILVRKLWKLL